MLNKEEFLEKNKAQLALDYFNHCSTYVNPMVIADFLDSQYDSYVNADKRKNAKAGQTLSEAFGIEPVSIRFDDIPMKSVSRDYVTLDTLINVNNKTVNLQLRFNYKELANV